MVGKLVLSTLAMSYLDAVAVNNPSLRVFDWKQTFDVVVNDPKSDVYRIQPLQTLTIFDGTRSTSMDNTSEFQLAASTIPGATNRYRITWDGTGTNPVFRTNRGLTCNGHTLTWVLQVNQTVQVTSSLAGDFSAVQVGDVFFIPDVTTGDAAYPGNPLNVGLWTVLVGGTTTIQLARPAGTTFQGASESVAITANSQVVAFSPVGLQVSDYVAITGGFASTVFGEYQILAVYPTSFEFVSTAPLPVLQTLVVPQTTGMAFYQTGKSWMRMFADQRCYLRFNGDTTSMTATLTPWMPGDPNNFGSFEKSGLAWRIDVVNRSAQVCNVVLLSASQ